MISVVNILFAGTWKVDVTKSHADAGLRPTVRA